MSEHIRKSQRQERALAKKIGGHVTAASGAFWSRKGDVQSRRYKIEAKRTDKKSISVTAAVWEKITREALLEGRVPALSLQIGDGINLIVMDENDWLEDRRRLGEVDGP